MNEGGVQCTLAPPMHTRFEEASRKLPLRCLGAPCTQRPREGLMKQGGKGRLELGLLIRGLLNMSDPPSQRARELLIEEAGDGAKLLGVCSRGLLNTSDPPICRSRLYTSSPALCSLCKFIEVGPLSSVLTCAVRVLGARVCRPRRAQLDGSHCWDAHTLLRDLHRQL